MKSIIIISPDYLSAIDKTMEKITMKLYGYGSWELAYTNLIHCDITELVGVAYVGESIDVGNKYMQKFLKNIEFSSRPVKILFCVNDDTERDLASLHGKYPNLKLCKLDSFYELTDQYILQNIIGNLLLFSSDAYKIENKVEEIDVSERNILNFRRFLSKEYCSIFDVDENYQEHKTEETNDTKLVKLLKKKRVCSLKHLNTDLVDSMISEELKNVKDDKLWCLYMITGGIDES